MVGISKKLCFLCLLTASFFGLQGQTLDAMLAKYPDKNACNIIIKRAYDISYKNDALVVVQSVTEERMYLNSKVSSAIKETVSFSGFYNLMSLSAETYVPNGTKYKKLPVKEFKVNSNPSNSVFYDDSKEKIFYFTHLSQGAKTRMDYQINITQPNLLSPFFLADYYPTERMEFSISFPDGVEIGYKVLHMSEDEYTLTKTKKGTINTYTWVRNNVKGAEFEQDGPNPKYYLAQIHPFIITSKTKDGVKTHVGTVDNLHKWYRDLIRDYETQSNESNEELVRIVDSLTVDLTDEKAKVQAIFSWVQTNIQYIAFEYELAGFVPRPAPKVCTRRFGDCKDMASIIKEMLNVAGIPAYLTWIGTRSIPYTYEQVPTPSVDNHMIATYFDSDGRAYFLDATDKYIPLGAASDHIQGKEALVSISETEYKVITVPISDQTFSQLIDSTWVKIDGSKIVGTGHMQKTGYYRNYSTYNLVGSTETQRQKYFKSVLEKGSNKFKLNSFKMSNLEDAHEPFDVHYEFELDNYITSYEDEVYVDLNFYKNVGTKIEADRELAYEYTFAKQHREVYVLEIPEGYTVTFMPKNFEAEMKDFKYSLTYALVGNRIIYEMRLDRSVLMMDKSYFEEWNKLFLGLTKMFSETVVLKKTI